MTARPTGRTPPPGRAVPARARTAPPRARPPPAVRSARPVSVSSDIGHREQQQLLEHHVLGQRARIVVGVADLLHAGRRPAEWAPSRRGCPRAGCRAVSGPCSTISAQNSWPKTQSAAASRAGTPTESMREVKWAKSPSAWRSDPQMPAARASARRRGPTPGTGSVTSPTTSWPSLVTAARMPLPPPPTARPATPSRRSLRPVSLTQAPDGRPVAGRRRNDNGVAMPILSPEHDLAHPVEGDTAWSESWYFNAYDPGATRASSPASGCDPTRGRWTSACPSGCRAASWASTAR